MRITHCLLCTLGTTQALTMSSYLTPLTNSQTAPLMFEPIHGDEVYCCSDPFFNISTRRSSTSKSIDCREHAMVLFINRRTRCILLEVPNAVGWKLHFGLALSKNEDVDARVAEAVAASGVKVESCVRTGVMLFTFRDCSEEPMRVSVYEASVDGGQTVGLFHAPEEIPYERMWADDRVWLPHVLRKGLASSRAILFLAGRRRGSWSPTTAAASGAGG